MDVRDVDRDDEDDPSPRRERPREVQLRRERREDERERGRPTERCEIRACAPEPRGSRTYRGEPPWIAAPITIARPMKMLPITMPREVF